MPLIVEYDTMPQRLIFTLVIQYDTMPQRLFFTRNIQYDTMPQRLFFTLVLQYDVQELFCMMSKKIFTQALEQNALSFKSSLS